LELHAIVPHFAVPVVPIIQSGATPFAMFSGLLEYRWVSTPIKYRTPATLVAQLKARVIAPAVREETRLNRWRAAAEAARG